MRLRYLAILIGLFVIAPAAARAQSGSTGSIAGSVHDTSGSVLPGVTVEASSPALIEKVRVAQTDAQGNYKIVDLRPGAYTITFTLPGFATFRREGVELTTGFTANVSAELKIGALEETVVVTGASPIVDVQNVRSQTVLSRDVIDTLPTGKTVSAFATLTLGVTSMSSATFDVGGNQGEQFFGFGVHGGKAGDSRMTQDGMQVNEGSTGSRRNQINPVSVQEVAIQTRGMSAETEVGGVQINSVPRDGGNSFAIYSQGNVGGPALQASNLTDDLRARGISAIGGIKKLYDIGVGVGGPIKKDKLWFYTAHRWWGEGNYNPGRYFNATQHTSFFYTPDLSQQAYNLYDLRDHSVRFTWQATTKNKFGISQSYQANCTCYKLSGGVDINRSPEASVDSFYYPWFTQVSWNNPVTNRLLFEAGVSYLYDYSKTTPTEVGVLPGDVGKQELTTGFKWGARLEAVGAGNDYGEPTLYKRIPWRATASYITGSHAFKAGVMGRYLNNYLHTGPEEVGVPPYTLGLRNGVPSQIIEWATPYFVRNAATEFGIFAQDQWTMKRLTVNAGLRLDALHGKALEQANPGGMFRAPTNFEEIDNLPNWKDVSPRLGVSYDVFGDGRTAAKVSLGRYVELGGVTIANANNPNNAIAQSATRTWTDLNGNLAPDCDLPNPLANGECAQVNNLGLGRPIAQNRWDPDLLSGWGNRGFNWQLTANLQHQLAQNLGVTFGYYRTTFGNQTVTDNLLVTPADYSPFCVTAPTDPRLEETSGSTLCGLYDINPNKFGQTQNLITLAKNFGDYVDQYNGFDLSITQRFGHGGLLQGGWAIGQTVTDNCFVVDSPQGSPTSSTVPGLRPGFCRNEQPWTANQQVKLAGVYPLPWTMQASATLQNVSTPFITANRTTPNAEIAPSLGRNLSAGVNGTVSIPLVADSTLYGDRLTQLDVRLTKIIKLGRARIQASVDAYNLFNASTVLTVNGTYGPAWQTPLSIIGARTFKFGGQLDW